MLPIIAGIAVVSAFGVGRAAFRAWRRVQNIPHSTFAEAINPKGSKAFSPESTRFLPGGFQDKMSHAEALDILGVQPGTSRKDILDRHRKIIMANHPDKGGSNYFASKINEAKDVLLRQSRFYVFYCVLHIVISLAVDAAITLPPQWTHPIQAHMLDLHMRLNQDPLIINSPPWLRAFVWVEIIFQIPFFAWAAYDLTMGNKRVWAACLAYGIEASTTTFACLAEIWASSSLESESLRWKLLGIYVPTLLVPLIMAVDFGCRITRELSKKPKQD